MTQIASAAANDTVAVMGLGNIGSHAVPLLAGIPGLRRALLVDFDRYAPDNAGRQRFAPAQAGRPKPLAQARTLRRLAPHLEIETHCCRIESVPLGRLRDVTLLCCVDSREARMALNAIAFALAIPWVDAALSRDGSVRARAYVPGHGDCLECGWGPDDYALLAQIVPCGSGAPATLSTSAPLELGAMAAALQVSIYRRLRDHATDLAGRQWFFDMPSGRGWTGHYEPNPQCRLDHRPWSIRKLMRGPRDLPLRDALGLSGHDITECALGAPGHLFVHRVRCVRCGRVRHQGARLSGRMATRTCRACGIPMAAAALDAVQWLTVGDVPPAALQRPLAQLGFVAGDIVAVRGPRGVAHFHLNDRE